jgi:hypothetical protein
METFIMLQFSPKAHFSQEILGPLTSKYFGIVSNILKNPGNDKEKNR